jgi:hypothetical protein
MTTSSHGLSIDPMSTLSLHLEVLSAGNVIASATGFVVADGTSHYLVTNRHVVTGRDPETGDPVPGGGTPDALRVAHHVTDRLGTWRRRDEHLFDGADGAGTQRWLEHPSDKAIDVAVLPLPPPDDLITYRPLEQALAHNGIVVEIAMPVCIVGFPLGLASAGMFPIWKTGHIASEPALNYGRQPVFLIDATTKPGMSGSPVLLRHYGPYRETGTAGAKIALGPGGVTRWLGIYSGRIHGKSEIGRVWRPETVEEIIRGE